MPPLDRRVFEDPLIYEVLRRWVSFERCVDIADAQKQLVAFKLIVREVAQQRDLWSFRSGTATARDEARLAIRAQAMWISGRTDEVARLRAVWPALAAHFDSRGNLREELALVRWIDGLVEAEAAEEMAHVAAAPTPEYQKAQARERVRQRAARWRVKRRRVTMQGLVSVDGSPLVDPESQGQEISRHWGEVFAEGAETSATTAERESFLSLVPDMSRASEWQFTEQDMVAAAGHTSDTSPGPTACHTLCGAGTNGRFARSGVSSRLSWQATGKGTQPLSAPRCRILFLRLTLCLRGTRLRSLRRGRAR